MILAALAALSTHPWSDKPVGRLPSAGIVGFARLPGLGRCVLTKDGSASYYKAGKILERPAEVYGERGDFGDIDGDGVDEWVQVTDDRIIDYVWRGGRFVVQDQSPLPRGRLGYDQPILVPGVDRGRAWLLLQGTPKENRDAPPDAFVAFRKVEDRWEKVWERSASLRSVATPDSNYPRWIAADSGRVLIQTDGQEFYGAANLALLQIASTGFRIVGIRHEHVVPGREPVHTLMRLPGARDSVDVSNAYYTKEGGNSKSELVYVNPPTVIRISALPQNASAVWSPQPGVRLLIVGQQVYRLNLPRQSR